MDKVATQKLYNLYKSTFPELKDSEIASELDTTRSNVSNWKKGKTAMSPIHAARIARATGYPKVQAVLEVTIDRCEDKKEAMIYLDVLNVFQEYQKDK
jgi:transcriptional regulator